MSDQGNKYQLDGKSTVQTITPWVKKAGDREKTVKFKIGRLALHVDYSKKTGKYTLREDKLTSCSPTVIAQKIFEHLQQEKLAAPPHRGRMAKVVATVGATAEAEPEEAQPADDPYESYVEVEQ